MKRYRVTYVFEIREHRLELEAESKEHARKLAREQLGLAIRIVDVIHLPEQHALF